MSARARDHEVRRFFLAHMQKTAGTTLRDRLRATFPDEQIYPNASDGADPRVSVISVSHLRERWAVRGHQIRLLTGHFPVRTVELLDASFVTMTILRHPVERTLSFLRHQAERRQRGATDDTPLVEIYEDPFRFRHMIQNHMVRTLSLAPEEMMDHDGVLSPVPYTPERLERAKEALAGLDLFGLQYRFEEFCGELHERYGLDVGDALQSNTTEPAPVPDRFIDRIAEDNALDMELYDHACRLYKERHPVNGSPAVERATTAGTVGRQGPMPRDSRSLPGLGRIGSLATRRRVSLTRNRSDGPVNSPELSSLVEVDRLVRDGRVIEAVDALARAYRSDPDPGTAVRLVELRHLAAHSLDPGSGRSPWPPSYDDPFPGLSGRLPEVSASDLTTSVLGGAVAHHGALIVRGLFDDTQVTRSVEVIRTAQAGRDEGITDGNAGAWYRPFPTDERQTPALRRMVAEQGGTWLADSPSGTAHFLDLLAAVGVIDVIARHLGEQPFFSLQKSTMRRSLPRDKLVAWHQDGSFLDTGVRTMNVWLALSTCGGDYPAPGLEVLPRRMAGILPIDGKLSPHSISFDLIDELASETPIVRPEFFPGDALMFDERFVHRTYLNRFMTHDRYALECWFFAPSHHSTGYEPFLA